MIGRALTLAVVALSWTASPTSAQTTGTTPPCADGTPSALRIVGLPTRIPLGREEIFRLDYGDADWEVTGAITITMRSGGSTFYEDTTRDELADLYVRLDLGDAPAHITARFAQRDIESDSERTCEQSVTATTRGFRHFGIIDRCDEPSYRPRNIIIACGDGNFGLTNARWRRWNRAVATARATAYANDCVPYCAVGRFRRYPVRLRAYRLRRMAGTYAYTRLRVSYPGTRPPGSRRTTTYRASADDYGFFWR